MKTETETENPSIDLELQPVIDDIKQSAGIAIHVASGTEEGTVKRFSYNHGEIPFPPLVLAPVVHALVDKGIECRMVRWDIDGPTELVINNRPEFDLWLTEELESNP